MSDKNVLQELIDGLKQTRDELKLQMHLAEMEARDEYDRLSGNFDELTSQFQPLKDAVGDTADNVIAALTLAAEEMKSGFLRVAKSLRANSTLEPFRDK